MSATEPQQQLIEDNEEAIRAWDGPLYERFVRFRETITDGSRRARRGGSAPVPAGAGRAGARRRLRLRRHHPADRRARRAGRRGGRRGRGGALHRGRASREAREAGVENARFVVADVQDGLDGEERLRPRVLAVRHDVLRQPGRRDAHRAGRARPGRAAADGRLAHGGSTTTGCIGRRRSWKRSCRVPRSTTSRRAGPARSRWPTPTRPATSSCAPASSDVSLRRCDIPISIGRDLEEALELVMALGPGRRDPPARGRPRRAPARAGRGRAARGARRVRRRTASCCAPASTWIVSARVPGA